MQSLQLIAFPVSAAQFSGCTAGAPCEADGDCPEPPEVLAKKPACNWVGKISPGMQLPPSSPYGSGCLSPMGDGLQPAISVPSFVLCVVLAVSYVQAFSVVAIPQSGLLTIVCSGYAWGVPARILQSTAACASCTSLPSSHLLVVDAGICTASPLGELLVGL